VAFESLATNLVAGDTNGTWDVFVRNTRTGATERVSVPNGGGQGNGESIMPAISRTGRFVAFVSSASNLVDGDVNGTSDAFVWDRRTHRLERVSIADDGSAGNGVTGSVAISGDGRFVAFTSRSDNLVAGDSNGALDVFVRDRRTSTTTGIISSNAPGSTFGALQVDISDDGRIVVFDSDASTLVAGDENSSRDVFAHDRATGTTELVSVGVSGPADGESGSAVVSGDGRHVAFSSDATDLVVGDTNGSRDVFVRDLWTGVTERVSVATDGTEGNGFSSTPSVTADGSVVAFISTSSNLDPADRLAQADVFVRDRISGTTHLVTSGIDGSPADGSSGLPSISGNGGFLAFRSFASNLVADDGNGTGDVFLASLRRGCTR
jgi:Tol biopolymer transport system component